MQIEDITNVEIDPGTMSPVNKRFALSWEDKATADRFHIWFADIGDLRAAPSSASTLYKNPPRGTPSYSPDYFATRSLNPAAKANREIVATVRQAAIKAGLHLKALTAIEAEEAKAKADQAERIRICQIKKHAIELLAALEATIPFLEAEQRTANYEVLPLTKARAAIAKATAA